MLSLMEKAQPNSYSSHALGATREAKEAFYLIEIYRTINCVPFSFIKKTQSTSTHSYLDQQSASFQ